MIGPMDSTGPAVSAFAAAVSLLKNRARRAHERRVECEPRGCHPCAAPSKCPYCSNHVMNQRIETKLSVNLNKVALLRNQRDVGYPSVTGAARLVIASGAHGITVHPRPDERHIRRSDVYELAALLRDEHAGRIEFNIEGNPTESFVELLLDVRPDQATLVPDAPDQRTSDHGWDFGAHGEFLKPVVERLRDAGIRVPLFVDPELEAVRGASAAGSDRIELYTEPYAAAYARGRYAE